MLLVPEHRPARGPSGAPWICSPAGTVARQPDAAPTHGRARSTIAAGLVGLCRPQIEALAQVLLVDGAVGQPDIRRILGPRIMPPAWIVAEVVAALLDAEGGRTLDFAPSTPIDWLYPAADLLPRPISAAMSSREFLAALI